MMKQDFFRKGSCPALTGLSPDCTCLDIQPLLEPKGSVQPSALGQEVA